MPSSRAGLGLLLLVSLAGPLRAEITIRLSVKFILQPDGTRPGAGNIGTVAGMEEEIARGNAILAATARGFRLRADYPGPNQGDIRPPVPPGEASDYWYALDARTSRTVFESAALADPVTWRWNPAAINLYVNNSSSGQCSFVGAGTSISLGSTVLPGTVLHELGHFFNLAHTHQGDYGDNPNTPPYKRQDLKDGDGLAETADDNPNINTQDQLCGALFNKTYATATAAERATVDSAFENVMSYHNENVLLPGQMDIWTLNANGARIGFSTGRTWFVDPTGLDGNTGENAGSPFATISRALTAVASPNDVVLLQTGSYQAPAGAISTPCTLTATRGPASIRR